MNYLISGASGLVGKRLVQKLEEDGNLVFKLVRKKIASDREIYWNPIAQELNIPEELNIDYVINLSGENIAEGRWSSDKKSKVLNSRIQATRCLVDAINKLNKKPKAFFSSSAIGFYRASDKENLTESSPIGQGFLADVCRAWEDEANKCSVRTINGRIGLVLSKEGGALQKMYLPFILGLGGKLGPGEQFWSWISIDDLVSAIIFTLNSDISGPVNLVSTTPINNKEFTKILGKVVKRPTFFNAPAWALRTIMGEMADELLLKSLPVVPNVLSQNNFKFQDLELEASLKRLLAPT